MRSRFLFLRVFGNPGLRVFARTGIHFARKRWRKERNSSSPGPIGSAAAAQGFLMFQVALRDSEARAYGFDASSTKRRRANSHEARFGLRPFSRSLASGPDSAVAGGVKSCIQFENCRGDQPVENLAAIFE
jgi:hypothetical protein